MRRTLIIVGLAVALAAPAGAASAAPVKAKKTQAAVCDFTVADPATAEEDAVNTAFALVEGSQKYKQKCTLHAHDDVKDKKDGTERKVHYKEKAKFTGQAAGSKDAAKYEFSCDFKWKLTDVSDSSKDKGKSTLKVKERLEVRQDGEKSGFKYKEKVKLTAKGEDAVEAFLASEILDPDTTCREISKIVLEAENSEPDTSTEDPFEDEDGGDLDDVEDHPKPKPEYN